MYRRSASQIRVLNSSFKNCLSTNLFTFWTFVTSSQIIAKTHLETHSHQRVVFFLIILFNWQAADEQFSRLVYTGDYVQKDECTPKSWFATLLTQFFDSKSRFWRRFIWNSVRVVCYVINSSMISATLVCVTQFWSSSLWRNLPFSCFGSPLMQHLWGKLGCTHRLGESGSLNCAQTLNLSPFKNLRAKFQMKTVSLTGLRDFFKFNLRKLMNFRRYAFLYIFIW